MHLFHILHSIHEIHSSSGKYSSYAWIKKSLLSQLLKYYIKPAELCAKLKPSQFGKYTLTLEEITKCCSESSVQPNYDEFDAELLYKLIKNLCPFLKPKNGWGEKPDIADIELGDDVERLVQFKDELFDFADPSEFYLRKYEEAAWNEIVSASERIHNAIKGNYKIFLDDLKKTKYTVFRIRRKISEGNLRIVINELIFALSCVIQNILQF